MRNFYPFTLSPQGRKIPLGTKLDLFLTIPTLGLEIYLNKIIMEVFSEQAKQDLRITFKVGDFILFQSGYIIPSGLYPVTLPVPIPITRLSSSENSSYNKVSNATSTGYLDNYIPESAIINYKVSEREVVKFKIKNQSDVYNHFVKLNVSGTFIMRK